MPCIVKGRIISALLPLQSNGFEIACECMAEVSFGDKFRQRTPATNKGMHPNWNQSFRIEVSDESEVQEIPLKFELLEVEGTTFGTVYLDLSNLLSNTDVKIEGWIPFFDSLNGLNGELNCLVSVEMIKEMNPYREAFGSISLYRSSVPPSIGYKILSLTGFVEELLVFHDPEYDWKDLIRSDRISNETRRNLLQAASMQTRRFVGKKALKMGANAVLGYQESIDLEGDVTHRISIRAVGTAVSLMEMNKEEKEKLELYEETPSKMKDFSRCLHSLTPVNVIFEPPGEEGIGNSERAEKGIPAAYKQVELFTLFRLPIEMDFRLGGIVAARSVKLLSPRLTQDERHAYWQELRDELRSHALSLCCDAIIGYSENISIRDEVMLLSCMGTAVQLNSIPSSSGITTRKSVRNIATPTKFHGWMQRKRCFSVHLSSFITPTEFPYYAISCKVCEEENVPSTVLATTECPEGLVIRGSGKGCEAHVCRSLKRHSAEAYATEVSEVLAFLELDLHRQLLFKIRLLGCNAAFGIKMDFSLHENFCIGTATATAVYILALPSPEPLLIRFPKLREKYLFYKDLLLQSKRIENQCKENITKLKEESLSVVTSFDRHGYFSADTFSSFSLSHGDSLSTSSLMQKERDLISAPKIQEKMNYEQEDTFNRDGNLSSFNHSRIEKRSDLRENGISPRLIGDFISSPPVVSSLMKTKHNLCFDVTDDADESLLYLLYSPKLHIVDVNFSSVDFPPGFSFFTATAPYDASIQGIQESTIAYHDQASNFFSAMRRYELTEECLSSTFGVEKKLSELKDEMLQHVLFSQYVRGIPRGCLASITWNVRCSKDAMLEILLVGHFLPFQPSCYASPLKNEILIGKEELPPSSTALPMRTHTHRPPSIPSLPHPSLGQPMRTQSPSIDAEALEQSQLQSLMDHLTTFLLRPEIHLKASINPADKPGKGELLRLKVSHRSSLEKVIGQGFLKEEIRTGEKTREIDFQNYKGAENPFVLISPLISLPFCVIERNFGLISLHVIKETIYFKSVETFYQELMAHSLAIVRAHVLALGGNAFLGYSIRNIYTKEDKNQHYAVLSIAGDVARVVYSQE